MITGLPCHGTGRLASANHLLPTYPTRKGAKMPQETDRLIVITGGPGSGKTSLIEALAAHGLSLIHI